MRTDTSGANVFTLRVYRTTSRALDTENGLRRKLLVLGTFLPVILALDIVTKRWALETLRGNPWEGFLGGYVPLTLAFNRGAAFGISIGNDPRWFFIPITVLALALLVTLFIQAEGRDGLRVVSLSLVVSGAIGNLIDRVRWDRGVVDFIGPIDLGFMDFPIFNVADMAISCGAVLLAISFWLEERKLAEAAKEAPAVVTGPEPTES